MDENHEMLRIDDCTEHGAKLHRRAWFDFESRHGPAAIRTANSDSPTQHVVYASDQDLIRLMRALVARFPLEALSLI